MSKAEILAELPRLSPDDLAEIQAKLDELVGDPWAPNGDLSSDDRSALERELNAYLRSPTDGRSWEDVRARIEARLQD